MDGITLLFLLDLAKVPPPLRIIGLFFLVATAGAMDLVPRVPKIFLVNLV